MINRIFLLILIFGCFLLNPTFVLSGSVINHSSSSPNYERENAFVVVSNRNNGSFLNLPQQSSFIQNQDTTQHANIRKIPFRIMEYNVENFFDAEHDSLKDDSQYLPDGVLHWTKAKYWKKMNVIARAIVLANTDSMDNFVPPALIAMCEVENDSCVYSLTHRSLLKNAGYDYVMTNSLDERGIDVALLYQPALFRLDSTYSLRVDTLPGMRKTRDILYVKGHIRTSGIEQPATDSSFSSSTTALHVFVVHAPSRLGGESQTRHFRRHVLDRLIQSADSVRNTDGEAKIVVLGDFNDYSTDANLLYLSENGFEEVSKDAQGGNNRTVKGTYQYRGQWESLDHVFVSPALKRFFSQISIADHPELLEPDTRNGGLKPKRFVVGRRVNTNGYSDHLPLLCDFVF